MSTAKSVKKKNVVPPGAFALKHYEQFNKISNFVMRDKMFLAPCPFKYNYMSYIITHKNPGDNDQTFQIYHESSCIRLLFAKKAPNVIGSKYIIFDGKQGESDPQVVGYVRGSLMKNQFFIFDAGFNPKKNKQPIRKQLAYITFSKQSLFDVGPKICRCVLPLWNRNSKNNEQQADQNNYSIQGIEQKSPGTSELQKKDKSNSNQVFAIISESPTFNPVKNIYQMNFKGLISEVSPFNCIMKNNKNQQCLIFGKRSNNTFIVYAGSPLSLLQAFGYFLANYQNKNH